MRATTETLEDNKVKLSVEVDETEVEGALDRAYRRMAKEVRFPGFRPGKVPRRLLEARLGADTLRNEALNDSLPSFYAQALADSQIDAIAAPEIEITEGKESGPVIFDAVVEIRPVITVPGYEGLEVTLPHLEVTPEEVESQIDRLRQRSAHLEPVERGAAAGDHLTIDLAGSRDGKDLPGLSVNALDYVLGAGDLIDGLDEALTGAKAGEERTFETTAPDGQPASFKVSASAVAENVLPVADDAWAADASEFATLEELQADVKRRLSELKAAQAPALLREATVAALVALVDSNPPQSLVDAEVTDRLNELGSRLDAQRVTLDQYMAITGLDREGILAQSRVGAADAVKADLALRAVAEAEAMEVSDADLEEEIKVSAARAGENPKRLRERLEHAGRIPTLRSELRKQKALNWLLEHVSVVDEEGRPIDRALLGPQERPQGGTVDQAGDATAEPGSDQQGDQAPAQP